MARLSAFFHEKTLEVASCYTRPRSPKFSPFPSLHMPMAALSQCRPRNETRRVAAFDHNTDEYEQDGSYPNYSFPGGIRGNKNTDANDVKITDLSVGSFNYAYISVVSQNAAPGPAKLPRNHVYDRSDLQLPFESAIGTFEPNTLMLVPQRINDDGCKYLRSWRLHL
jgi:hypothetical protein